MSRELADFSDQIDEEFEVEEKATKGIISYLLSLFA